ncbi:hypothetical protein OUZ56_009451 [Daphnia magna]|uniref:Uncharacterized protein n=1 Tax=Daphnia magna TaxID=35525 RepID=A0ABR0AG24_9CRUS|nr:hypothetical protein OUZ56_009451 [Daphnia magna]
MIAVERPSAPGADLRFREAIALESSSWEIGGELDGTTNAVDDCEKEAASSSACAWACVDGVGEGKRLEEIEPSNEIEDGRLTFDDLPDLAFRAEKRSLLLGWESHSLFQDESLALRISF